MKTLVTNARLVCPANGVSQGSLLVEDGKIAAIGEIDAPADTQAIDARGHVLAPAILDLGVFKADPAASRAGGIVRLGLMPDQSPVLDDPGIVQRAAQSGKPDLWIHPIAAATRGLAGIDLAEMTILKDAGARAVSTGRGRIANASVMRKVLAYARDLNLTVIAHAEDCGLAAGAVATTGEAATRLGLPSAPPVAEALAVARDLMLAEDTQAAIHFRIVSTAQAIDLIRRAKARGVRVTCGTTPAHLYLSDIAMSDFRTFAHLSPPLRSESDRQATRAGVADGTIDVIASSHDPRGPEEKRLPFADSLPGAAGAATLLALSLGLVRDELVSIERLMAMLSANPAKLLGLDYGTLGVGSPADLMVVDAGAPWKIDGNTLPGLAANTPFDGLPVQGKVTHLMKGGVYSVNRDA